MELNTVHYGDCLELMKGIKDKSIDMILCDLPYGTTACRWDVIIPFKPLWEQYERIIKDNGAIILTASQPFTSLLAASNIKMFNHSQIWVKTTSGNFQQGSSQPIKVHEDVLVFSKGGFTYNAKNKCTYNPQMINRETELSKRSDDKRSDNLIEINYRPNPTLIKRDKINLLFKLPTSIIKIPSEIKNKVHPTQKPVALFEYLIKTYTNEGETVLDNTAGSGTTAMACINTSRNYILMEKEEKYYNVIKERIANHKLPPKVIQMNGASQLQIHKEQISTNKKQQTLLF